MTRQQPKRKVRERNAASRLDAQDVKAHTLQPESTALSASSGCDNEPPATSPIAEPILSSPPPPAQDPAVVPVISDACTVLEGEASMTVDTTPPDDSSSTVTEHTIVDTKTPHKRSPDVDISSKKKKRQVVNIAPMVPTMTPSSVTTPPHVCTDAADHGQKRRSATQTHEHPESILPTVDKARLPDSAFTESLRQRREILLQQTITESITNKISSNMSTSIAEEFKARIGCNLNRDQRDSNKIVFTFVALGRSYWPRIYQDGNPRNLYMTQQLSTYVYTKEHVSRALYFWATHQHRMSFGDISYELRLPFNALLPWILDFLYST